MLIFSYLSHLHRRIRVAPGTTLEVSCIGYENTTVSAADNMRVTLQDDAEMLEETVVIGYGVQKKSDLTGAVASVRSDDLKDAASAAIYGAQAGNGIVLITTKTGAASNGWHKGMNYNWFDAVFAPSWAIQNGLTFQGTQETLGGME